MENDYVHSKESHKIMDNLGISYQWRDSCVNLLIDLKKCKKVDYFAGVGFLFPYSSCFELEKLYDKCQFNREMELASKFFTNYEKKEKEYIEKIKKVNKN
jgi:hypothetical protein